MPITWLEAVCSLQHQFDKKPISEIDLTCINPLDKDILKRTAESIEQHIDDTEYDIPVLCKEVGIGRSLLYTKFKALTGMTPNNFILNYRLNMLQLYCNNIPIFLLQKSVTVAGLAHLYISAVASRISMDVLRKTIARKRKRKVNSKTIRLNLKSWKMTLWHIYVQAHAYVCAGSCIRMCRPIRIYVQTDATCTFKIAAGTEWCKKTLMFSKSSVSFLKPRYSFSKSSASFCRADISHPHKFGYSFFSVHPFILIGTHGQSTD